MFYIYAEDLVAGVTGPFDTIKEAAAHIAFCRERGDADPGHIISQTQYDGLGDVFTLTPEQDRLWKFPEEKSL